MRLPTVRPLIYLITKGDATVSNFPEKRTEILDLIGVAVEEKVSLIQLREKALTARLLFELARDAAAITRGSETRLLVNDRADIALAAKADGVHLAGDSISTSVIRSTFPKGFLIGVSTHSGDSATQASNDGADFAVFGPVFETPGKGRPQGIEKLKQVCAKVLPFPVLALGGVNEQTFASVLEAGAEGFAAIRALNDPGSLRAICSRLRVKDEFEIHTS